MFIPQTRPKKQEYRLLVLDGYKSYESTEFNAICRRNKVILLTLPPHTSHVLQPLDLAEFSPLKTRYRAELYDLQQFNDGAPIKKKIFLELYAKARLDCFTSRNIRQCFNTAGLCP